MKTQRESISVNWIHQEGRDPHWSPRATIWKCSFWRRKKSHLIKRDFCFWFAGTSHFWHLQGRFHHQSATYTAFNTCNKPNPWRVPRPLQVCIDFCIVATELNSDCVIFFQSSIYGFTTMALVKWPYSHGLGACYSGTWATTIFLGLYRRRSATA